MNELNLTEFFKATPATPEQVTTIGKLIVTWNTDRVEKDTIPAVIEHAGKYYALDDNNRITARLSVLWTPTGDLRTLVVLTELA